MRWLLRHGISVEHRFEACLTAGCPLAAAPVLLFCHCVLEGFHLLGHSSEKIAIRFLKTFCCRAEQRFQYRLDLGPIRANRAADGDACGKIDEFAARHDSLLLFNRVTFRQRPAQLPSDGPARLLVPGGVLPCGPSAAPSGRQRHPWPSERRRPNHTPLRFREAESCRSAASGSRFRMTCNNTLRKWSSKWPAPRRAPFAAPCLEHRWPLAARHWRQPSSPQPPFAARLPKQGLPKAL